MTDAPRDPAGLDRAAARASTLCRSVQHGLVLLVAGVWLLFLIEWFSPARIPIADYGALIGPLALAVVIPAAALVRWWLGRRARASGARRRSPWSIASGVFVWSSWGLSLLPTLWLIALFQPWPLTLCEGPDTEFARAGFARICGIEPPPSVRSIHYRVDGPRDPTFFLRCEGADRVLLERVAARLRIEAVGPETSLALASIGRAPAWWPSEPDLAFDAVLASPDGRVRLWFRERDGLLLYRELTF